MTGFMGGYIRVLEWSILRPWTTLSFAMIALVASFVAYGHFGNGLTFFPDVEPDYAQVEILAKDNFSVFEQDALVRQVEARIAAYDEIASVYAKILTDQLTLNTFEQQYELISKLFQNVSRLEQTGRIAPFEKLRIQALVQQDSAAVIASKNALELSKFLLKQLINAPDSSKGGMQFEVLSEDQMKKVLRPISEWNVDSILELRIAQLNLASAQNQLKVAQASYLPSLSLNSALGTGYSGNNTTLIGTNLVPKPMGTQIRENLYQTAVLSLVIPIFNQYSVKNKVKLSQIQIDQARLEIEASKIQIINNIESLLIDYENELINLNAKKRVFETNQAVFQAVEKMFLVGTSNYVEFVEGKFALTRAQLDYQLTLSKCYGLRLLLDNFITQ
jgi:outer membrane protein TolC